jgi:hypothetical protein
MKIDKQREKVENARENVKACQSAFEKTCAINNLRFQVGKLEKMVLLERAESEPFPRRGGQ